MGRAGGPGQWHILGYRFCAFVLGFGGLGGLGWVRRGRGSKGGQGVQGPRPTGPQTAHKEPLLKLMAKKAPTKESRRFIPVSVKDVERHCERCAHLPHRIVKDVKAFLQKKKPFLLKKEICVFQAFV